MAFGSTITGGIQDVSALLPLLGTEQCEDHVGSALVNGFLYASAAPLSIFGSLGIVRAGFKALAASVVVRGKNFMGAEKLENAGFGPAGKALSQIMWRGERHIAETQLIARLEELHITNVKNLAVEADNSVTSWNWKMLGWSLAAVMLSITPYIYLIKNDDVASVERLFYPLARSIGSALVSNLTQIIIQTRLLEIIKHRIVFIALDDHARAENIQLPSEWWDTRLSSEVALHHLETYLNPAQEESRFQLISWMGKCIYPPTVSESHQLNPLDAKRQLLKTRFETIKAHHLPRSTTHFRRMLLGAQFAVTFSGLVLTIVGYVGCFSLVQESTSVGSVLWLIFEVMLSLLRMAVWASNPEWDDTFLDFRLKLANRPPFPTCNNFSEELDEEKVLPLTRSGEFLAKITSFVGLLDPLEIAEDGVALYYTMTRRREDEVRVMYITVHDYKENISQVFICPDLPDPEIACRSARLNMETGVGAVSVKLEELLANNRMTKDPTFRHRLHAHCNSIFRKLVQRSSHGYSRVKMTWELKPEAQPMAVGCHLDQDSLELEQRSYDLWYLEGRGREQYLQAVGKERCLWVDEHISLITENILKEQPQLQDQEEHLTHSTTTLYETVVTEYFILYASEWMQWMLIDETRKVENMMRYYSTAIAQIGAREFHGSQALEIARHRANQEGKRMKLERLSQDAERVKECLVRLIQGARARIEMRGHHKRTEIPVAASLQHWQDFENRMKQAWLNLIVYIAQRRKPVGILQEEVQFVIEEHPVPMPPIDNSDIQKQCNTSVRTPVLVGSMHAVTQHQIGSPSEEPERYCASHTGIIPPPVIPNASVDQNRSSEAALTALHLTPYFTEFMMNTQSSIDEVTEWAKMTMTEGEYKDAGNRLRKTQSKIQKWLNDEHRMMMERLENMKDNWYGRFVPQHAIFMDSPLVTHLALSKCSKFVRLSRQEVKENGIVAIARALGRNPVISYIHIYDLSLHEILTIIRFLQKAKSVSLSIWASVDESEVDMRKLEEAVQGRKNIVAMEYHSPQDIPEAGTQPAHAATQNRNNLCERRDPAKPFKLVFYRFVSVEINDEGLGNYSYLDLWDVRESGCTVLFSVPATKTVHGTGAEQLILRLNHRFGEIGGIVDIKLNATFVPWDQHKCPRDEIFAVQDIVVPRSALKPADAGVNELTIDSSGGWYALRDVPQLVWKDVRDGEIVW